MGYNLGLLLSMTFMMAVMLLSGDLVNMSQVHSFLDSIALTVSYKIQNEGVLSDSTKSFVIEHGANITVLNTETPSFGEVLKFKIYKNYQPMIIASGILTISVTRSALVGYYIMK